MKKPLLISLVVTSIVVLAGLGYFGYRYYTEEFNKPQETGNLMVDNSEKYTDQEKSAFCDDIWKNQIRPKINYSVDSEHECDGFYTIGGVKGIFVQVFAPNGFGTKGVITFSCTNSEETGAYCMTFKGKYIEDLIKLDSSDLLKLSDEMGRFKEISSLK